MKYSQLNLLSPIRQLCFMKLSFLLHQQSKLLF